MFFGAASLTTRSLATGSGVLLAVGRVVCLVAPFAAEFFLAAVSLCVERLTIFPAAGRPLASARAFAAARLEEAVAAAPGGGFSTECGRAVVVGAEVLPAGFVDVEAIGYLPAPGRAGIAIVGGIGFQIIGVF